MSLPHPKTIGLEGPGAAVAATFLIESLSYSLLQREGEREVGTWSISFYLFNKYINLFSYV